MSKKILKSEKTGKFPFLELMKIISCDSDDLHGAIGFSAQLEKSSLSFYGVCEDDFTLRIEDFGYEENGGWIQLTPTKEQFSQMQTLLTKKFHEVYDHEQQKLKDQQRANSYDVREHGLYGFGY